MLAGCEEPKSEIRNKFKKAKSERLRITSASRFLALLLRISDLFRISNFEVRIEELAPPGLGHRLFPFQFSEP
jgi:hypothetical protein